MPSRSQTKATLFVTLLISLFTLLFGEYFTAEPVTLTSTKSNNLPLVFDKAQVVDVVDGDTIKVKALDTSPEFVTTPTYVVRLIGIDAPETHKPNAPKECYGEEATEYLRNLILGKTVTLKKDKSDTDKYNRLLRYVYLDDVFVNEALVQNGFAKAKAYKPDISMHDVLDASQGLAVQRSAGMWGNCTL
ncbi:MAG: thermonuclease family protein [Patescibacteria group bacterium]